MYIEVEKETGQLALKLPNNLDDYRNEVSKDLMQEFAFESVNKQVLEEMNDFIINWFKERNIEL